MLHTCKMAKFTEHGVVPDVLSVAPSSVAEVTWPSGVKAELGNVLTPTQVASLSNYGRGMLIRSNYMASIIKIVPYTLLLLYLKTDTGYSHSEVGG